MKLSLMAVVVACLLTSACKKASPAQPAVESWLTLIAQNRGGEAAAFLAEGTTDAPTDPRNPLTDGVAEHFMVNYGELDWSKYKLESEKVLPDGRRELNLLADICLKAENQQSCMRPNSYRFFVRMVEQGGQWKVSASAFENVNLVR